MLAAVAWRGWRRGSALLILVKVWKTSKDIIGCRCQVSRVVVVEIAEEPWRSLA